MHEYHLPTYGNLKVMIKEFFPFKHKWSILTLKRLKNLNGSIIEEHTVKGSEGFPLTLFLNLKIDNFKQFPLFHA
jgi:hypothetical protein